ncbi:hypothetical protein BDN70DRAFT_917904 [Pholiota conissans]|uniref:Reverse transcriptase domain-containing protein n=1 Tax=Pholiota conissans TaxID=109636 RepID=A0A9P6D564_9AGAR|nr:hypothetical protein BDN70DRAFT_917904 [Pholiota conissans]
MVSITTTNAKGSGNSFGQTLQFITDIKLQELEKQRQLHEAHAHVVDEARAFAEQGDVLKQVSVLAKAVKSWTGFGALDFDRTVGGKLNLNDLEFFLQQARSDPSFSREIATRWAETLEAHIQHTTKRFDSGKLFGKLFNEWLASGDSAAIAPTDNDADAPPSPSDFVEVGRKELHEQKEKLLSIIFEEPKVDVAQITRYLEDLFESEEATRVLEQVRKEIKLFGKSLQRKTLTLEDVKNTIAGLLASDLMDEDKRTTLKAFQENPIVLQEVASVLTMRMAGLESWEWPEEGMLVEFRRHLNGKYRAFTDPEIIDALLLHYIGVQWQVELKATLIRVFNSRGWIRPTPPTHATQESRKAQLRDDDGKTSIEAEREKMRSSSFFLTQLQDEVTAYKSYEERGDAPAKVGKEYESNPASVKQKLLQIMTTECYLNTSLHGTHAAICSDLEWFGPSLPHASILTILEFLGMSKPWLRFYKAFLAAPIRFPGDPEPRVRKRGTPIGYSLSVACGEIVVFIMDFAVNQHAKGLYLYRMHDDLWLWDADVKKVASGWAEMRKYAALVGLKFNEPKTGSAYIGPQSSSNSALGLPAGDIRWGFLKFDPEQKRFRLDQTQVDQHIVEMRRQLASTKSVFGWVNAYNKYMSFFFRNFGGSPARCFGTAHIVEMVDTLARIQRELFPVSKENPTGSAVGYLRKVLEERFGMTDLPEGYFYFPIGSGGLELRNLMLELLVLEKRGKPLIAAGTEYASPTDEKKLVTADRNENGDEDDEADEELSSEDYDSDDEDFDWDNPASLEPPRFMEDDFLADQKFAKRMEYDRKVYARAKEVWDQDQEKRRRTYGFSLASDSFMSFEEYSALRESWMKGWGDSYRDMLKEPDYMHPNLLPEVSMVAHDLPKPWSQMDWYEQWIVSMYGEGVVKKYGGLKAVHSDAIPVGMVELFRTSRMKLDQ